MTSEGSLSVLPDLKAAERSGRQPRRSGGGGPAAGREGPPPVPVTFGERCPLSPRVPTHLPALRPSRKTPGPSPPTSVGPTCHGSGRGPGHRRAHGKRRHTDR